MKLIQFMLTLCAMLTTHVFVNASITPYQDTKLIERLQSNQIRLIVLRHGEAIHNLTYMAYSNPTPGVYLTDLGKEQVQKASEDFYLLRVNMVYTSPLYRALQTAQIIAKQLRLPYYKIKVQDALREQYYGTFEEKTYQELKEYFPTKQALFTDAVPEGELGIDVFNRLRLFLWKIAAQHKKETVLVITHGLNCSQINMCLTGQFGEIPVLGSYTVYDYLDNAL